MPKARTIKDDRMDDVSKSPHHPLATQQSSSLSASRSDNHWNPPSDRTRCESRQFTPQEADAYLNQLKVTQCEAESFRNVIKHLLLSEQLALRKAERYRKSLRAHASMLEDTESDIQAIRQMIIAGGYECDLIASPFTRFYRAEKAVDYKVGCTTAAWNNLASKESSVAL